MNKTGPKGNHASLAEFETKVSSEIAVWREAEWGEMRLTQTIHEDFRWGSR